MIVIEIIVLFVFATILSRQNTRISSLEKRIAGGAMEQKSVPEAASVSTASVPVKAPVTEQAYTSVASTSVPISPASLVPKKPQVAASVPQAPAAESVSSGRILAFLGIAAVFIGVAFFLKYAFDNNWVSPAGRIMLGIASGALMLGIGQVLRKKYLEYSDFLMGGGLALLYLSVSFAHFYFHLIPSIVAWMFMALITLIGLILSLVNATKVLALVSVVGGFLVPFMARSGGNDMVALFGYLSILNIGVLSLSFFKNWKELTLASFIGTAINFVVWFAAYYSVQSMGITLTFCTATFLIFLAASIIRCVSQKIKADELDYFLLGGNALFLAIYGYTMLNVSYHDWLGAGSVLIAIVYLFVALIVNKENRDDTALNIFLPGLSVTFFSIAIPMQFSGPWISVSWLVESVVLYTIAVFVGNRGFQVMGAVTYVIGLIGFAVWNLSRGFGNEVTPLLNGRFVLIALAFGAAYIIAYIYYKYGSSSAENQKNGISVFTTIGNTLVIIAVIQQFSGISISVGWIAEALVFYIVAAKIGKRAFQITGATAYVLGIVYFFIARAPLGAGQNFVPIANPEFLTLTFAVVVAYAISYMYVAFGTTNSEVEKKGLSAFVIGANILTIYAITSQIVFYFNTFSTVSAQNYSNMLVSIFWAVYAALLTAIGFIKKLAGIRRLGLILFIVTAFKVVIDVWSLGQIYRIVSLITFGIIALAASFAYAKYKDRLKDVI